ncbi:MAG: polysaccharide biosynthesis protein [Saprospiraceae bacterium]
MMFDLNAFIATHVIKRKESFFQSDLERHASTLKQEIDGSSVLVIGGAGTIGASYIRALLRCGTPAQLLVVDINENGLTELTRDLRSTPGLVVPPDYKTYPINFSDPVFAKLFRQQRPFDIVANFAAHKHVRSEKDPYSIEAMIENNVLKARDLLDLLAEHPPRHFFCVSTDKAANPVNVMGASKKLMEEVIMAYANRMKITTARFANVAFSNGSLPAGFLERLAKRQPLSAPQDIRRFFVSPAESGEICLMACLLGRSGQIFFPKLDPDQHMETFTHIADRLLEAHGFLPFHCASEQEAKQFFSRETNPEHWTEDRRPTTDANVGHRSSVFGPKKYPVYYFTSDTSGEKPYEEFYTTDDDLDLDTFASLGVIRNAPRPDLAQIDRVFSELRALFQQPRLTKEAVVQVLERVIPGFAHIETGKGLDQKM